MSLAAAADDRPTWFQCSLCGHRFTHDDQACPRCPLARGCDIVECPNCHFQFPRQSRFIATLQRLVDRVRRRT